MTHNELLAKIDYTVAIYEGLSVYDVRVLTAYLKALRAVVELHKPIKAEDLKNNPKESGFCLTCTPLSLNFYEAIRYPCPTIQTIEKELI